MPNIKLLHLDMVFNCLLNASYDHLMKRSLNLLTSDLEKKNDCKMIFVIFLIDNIISLIND